MIIVTKFLIHNQLMKSFPLLKINQHPNKTPKPPTQKPCPEMCDGFGDFWMVGEQRAALSPHGVPAAGIWGWIHRQDGEILFMDCSLGWRFGSWVKQPGTASSAPEKPKSSFLDLSDFMIFRFWGSGSTLLNLMIREK